MATLDPSSFNTKVLENGKPHKPKPHPQKNNFKIKRYSADFLTYNLTETTDPKPIHANIIKTTSFQFHPHLLTQTLLSYAKLGYLKEAHQLFDQIITPDTFQWNTIIIAYATNGYFQEALQLFHKMQLSGVPPDHFTFPLLIKSCSRLFSYWQGRNMHAYLIKIGLVYDIFISNSLINMYGNLGCIGFAHQVFDEMTLRDLVSWNSLMGGYVWDGDGWNSFLCFRDMQELGVEPDRFTLIEALAAASLENYGKQGKEIHAHIIRSVLEPDLMLEASLIDMYCKCGNMGYAERLFSRISQRSSIVWNSLIAGYDQDNQPFQAFSCLFKMQAETDPDSITMVSLLPSCAQLRTLLQGKSIHGFAMRRGFFPYLVLETALIDMYAKCGSLKSAGKLFDKMLRRNLVSWNAMISGYAQNGYSREALALFYSLLLHINLEPDAITISSILPAYAELSLLRQAKQIHGYITKCGYYSNTYISNSLVDMYAKCGDLPVARRIFDSMLTKDIGSWNTIIAGYGLHGAGRIALELFSEMQENGIEPNGSTYVSVLSSCSISGLVSEGWEHFNSMQRDYGIDPRIEHYGCMIDLLGRSKCLDLAENFVMRMPLPPTARIWGSLLRASRNSKNIELAERVAKHIFALDHDNIGCYILLSNLYAEANRWEDVEMVRMLMKNEGLEKMKGCSTIELNGKTSNFVGGDKSHPERQAIYEILDIVSRKIGEAVYVPNAKFKPSEVIKKKENLPHSHSVRLAICFGLISTTVGNPILLKKNFRICSDCHHAAKLISKVTRREIIVGDSRIYHHFKDGFCCCHDYW